MTGLLSYEELAALAARGVIRNVELEYINAASIDITLGGELLVEQLVRDKFGKLPQTIALRDRTPLLTQPVTIPDEGFVLEPGQFILAHSEQTFNLPRDISAEYKLKSSMARIGINHCLAGWCDAGWNGSALTLELMNVTRGHRIVLHKGDRIGQMIFFHHREVPLDASYAQRGRYNGDRTVMGAKS